MDVKQNVKKQRTSVGSEVKEGTVEVEGDGVDICSDKQQLNDRNLAADSAVSDVSKVSIDGEKPDDVMLASDQFIQEVDEKEDTVGVVADEGEELLMLVTDVWRQDDKTEISESCDAITLDDADFQKENLASHDAAEMSNLTQTDEEMLSTFFKNAMESAPDSSLSEADAVDISREKDKLESDVLLYKSAKEANEINTVDNAFDKPVEEQCCETILESVSLLAGTFSDVSDDMGAESCNSTELAASITEQTDIVSENSLSSSLPAIGENIANDEKGVLLVENEHQGSVQHKDESCVESEVCVRHEDEGNEVKDTDGLSSFQMADDIAASICDFLAGSSPSDNVQDMPEDHDNAGQNDSVSNNTSLVCADDVFTQQESSVQLFKQADEQSSEPSNVDRNSQSKESAEEVEVVGDRSGVEQLAENLDSLTNEGTVCTPQEPAVIQSFTQADEQSSEPSNVDHNSQSKESTEEVEVVDDRSGLEQLAEKLDSLTNEGTVCTPQEPVDIQSFTQADEQGAEASNVDNDSQRQGASAEIEDRPSMVPLAKNLDSSSNDSTVSYKSSEMVKSPAGYDVQKEYAALSTEHAAEDAQLHGCLSSDDIPPANDRVQVSDSVIDNGDNDDYAGEHMLPASEDIGAAAAAAAADDEDFEIDLL